MINTQEFCSLNFKCQQSSIRKLLIQQIERPLWGSSHTLIYGNFETLSNIYSGETNRCTYDYNLTNEHHYHF